jgi:hypothetical protein
MKTKRKEPSMAIMLGMPKGKDDDDEAPESGEVESESEVDPAVDAKLSEAFPDLDGAGRAALVEAFHLCFEQWEREPHEESEHEEEY